MSIYKLVARYTQKNGSFYNKPGTQFKKWTYIDLEKLQKYRKHEHDFSNIRDYDLSLHVKEGKDWKCLIESNDKDILEFIKDLKE